MKKLISFIVPVLNEQENVGPLAAAVGRVMAPLAEKYDYELIFTDNHSTDATFQKLSEMGAQDGRIRVFRFSRNFGYQRSIFTGYLQARGDAALQLDCDMQDPPELIPQFLDLWEQGNAVVYGIRATREEGGWKHASRKIFYRLVDLLSEIKLPHDAGDFRLVDRRVLNELSKLDDARPYLRGTIAGYGFNQIGVPYHRPDRKVGETKFPVRDMVELALDGIINHSIIPLRIASLIGIVFSFVTFLMCIGYLIGKFILGANWQRGFATSILMILASASLNAFFFGIIGEYLGRIYLQVKKGPVTIVEKTVNAEIPPSR